MKFMQRIIALGAFMAGTGAMSTAVAADAPKTFDQAAKADAVCTRCHDESETKPILSIYQTKHGVKADGRTPTCQECHGESKNHLGGNVEGKGRPKPDIIYGSKKTTAGYVPSSPEEQTGTCLTCHKSGMRTHWDGSQHQANEVVCANCHTVHAAKDPMLVKTKQPEVCYGCHKEQRAQTKHVSTHPLDAGKMACSDCHNPHGSAGPKLLKKATVTETCFTCHADKRGPFLWEHQPVSEDCLNCHTPHGSNITPLLKDRAPYLCDDCHNGPHQSSGPIGPGISPATIGGAAVGSSNAAGRSCMNCHVMVHGTNSPTGAYLHR